MIDKACLNDTRLSWKARGILAYLLSKPDDWEVLTTDLLVNSDHDGVTAVRSAMKELVDCGYAELQSIQGQDGRMLGRRYIISEISRTEGVNPLGIPC